MQFFRVIGFLAVLVASSFAGTLTIAHTGTGYGTLNGIPFGATDFTIIAIANTANVTGIEYGVRWVKDDSASISIDGLGSFMFIGNTYNFDNYADELVGFGGSCCDLFNGPRDTAFGTWDMLSSVGPIHGGGQLMQWEKNGTATSGGTLLLFGTMYEYTTFTATLSGSSVPEPASFWFAAAALLGLAAFRRKSHNQS